MATFLDTGLLQYFSVIFPTLLIFVVVFAIFERYKLLGESRSINALVAIAVAFMVLLFQDVADIINFISPWFVLVFIFVILLLMVYKIMGARDETLTQFIETDNAVKWFIFAIGIVIIVAGFSHVYGQRLLTGEDVAPGEINRTAEVGAGEGEVYEENLMDVFFHPKVLGLIFILLVAVFTVSLLTREAV